MLKAKRAKPASEIIRDPLRCFFVESVQVVVGRDHGDMQSAAEKSWIIGWLREQRTFAPKLSTKRPWVATGTPRAFPARSQHSSGWDCCVPLNRNSSSRSVGRNNAGREYTPTKVCFLRLARSAGTNSEALARVWSSRFLAGHKSIDTEPSLSTNQVESTKAQLRGRLRRRAGSHVSSALANLKEEFFRSGTSLHSARKAQVKTFTRSS